jgi:hypothetical protein
LRLSVVSVATFFETMRHFAGASKNWLPTVDGSAIVVCT